MLTRNNLRKLVLKCGFNPTEIGLVIMKLLGYKVTEYFTGTFYINDKDGRTVYFFEPSDYAPYEG